MIGTVTKSGQAVVVNDTTTRTVRRTSSTRCCRRPAPKSRCRCFPASAFWARSTCRASQSNSFQPDEVRTFEILADQIAVAIQNVRLLVQSEQRITQIDTLNRQLTRSAWEETSERSGLETVYRYDLLHLDA